MAPLEHPCSIATAGSWPLLATCLPKAYTGHIVRYGYQLPGGRPTSYQFPSRRLTILPNLNPRFQSIALRPLSRVRPAPPIRGTSGRYRTSMSLLRPTPRSKVTEPSQTGDASLRFGPRGFSNASRSDSLRETAD